MSSITAICGAFSHSKLTTPPDVLNPMRVSERECAEIAQTQFLTTEDQRQVRIPLGSSVSYKFIESGSVTFSETNANCEGGEMKLKGQKHENVLKLVTVSFTLAEVEVWEKRGRLRVDDGMLPRQCSLAAEGCALDDLTILIDLGKVNLCPYTQIRTEKFEAMTYDTKFMLINDEHKLVVEVKEKIPIPSECVLTGNFIKTNFERLLLFKGELGQSIDLIDPATLDLELETRVTDMYISLWTLGIVKESEARWQSEICGLNTDRMHEDQTILHGNHVLRLQGEMVLEFPCEKIRVRTRTGMKLEGENCLDHLPVFTPENTIAYLTPITRILTSRAAVSVVNCSAHYPLLFEDINGYMVTANPGVQKVEVSLSDYHHLNPDSGNHSEVFAFSSLLYTKDEISAYEQIIMGHGAEKAITRKFSSYYCSATGECSPSRGTSDFQWNKLVNPEEYLEEWYEKMKTHVMWWGVTWACIDSILTIIQTLIKLAIVVKNIGKKQLTGKSVFKFVFMPGHELINLFPRKEESIYGTHYEPHPPMESHEMLTSGGTSA
jgi:hypothetical protein